MKRALDDGCTEVLDIEAKHVVPSILNTYAIDRRLGSGSQGEVRLARRHSSGEEIAIKLLPITNDAWNELRAYRILAKHEKHGNVLQLSFSAADKYVAPPALRRVAYFDRPARVVAW